MEEGSWKVLGKAGSIFDAIINVMAGLAGVVLVFMMLSVSLSVVTRYFFNHPLIWVLQLNEYSLLYHTLLGAPWLLKKDGHVGVDVVVALLRPGAQRTLKLVYSIVGSALWLGVFWYGTLVSIDAYRRGLYPSHAVLPIPDVYVLFIIPLVSLMLFIEFARIAVGLWGDSGASSEPGPIPEQQAAKG